jgi:hypothetical protein
MGRKMLDEQMLQQCGLLVRSLDYEIVNNRLCSVLSAVNEMVIDIWKGKLDNFFPSYKTYITKAKEASPQRNPPKIYL